MFMCHGVMFAFANRSFFYPLVLDEQHRELRTGPSGEERAPKKSRALGSCLLCLCLKTALMLFAVERNNFIKCCSCKHVFRVASP